MAYALLKPDQVSMDAANDKKFAQGEAAMHNLELERRLKAFSITLSEYKRRVAVQLKGNIIGITSEEDIDILLASATKDILGKHRKIPFLKRDSSESLFLWLFQ